MSAPHHHQAPRLKRRRLGSELRRLREAAGLTGDQVIERAGWASASKLSRLENGKSRPDPKDIQRLLDIYGVHGDLRDELLEITEQADDERRWLRAYGVMTERQRGTAELEAGCADIREYCQVTVPGLLQTREYARLRIASAQRLAVRVRPDQPGIEELEKEVNARLARQSVLREDPPPTRYTALLDEAVLEDRAGAPEVVRGQLRQLCRLAALPHVTIQVIPRGVKIDDWYLPPTSFSLYRFPDPHDPETVSIEGINTNFVSSDPYELDSYKVLFEWLQAAALSVEESLAFLTDAAGRRPGASRLHAPLHTPAKPPAQRAPHTGRLTER